MKGMAEDRNRGEKTGRTEWLNHHQSDGQLVIGPNVNWLLPWKWYHVPTDAKRTHLHSHFFFPWTIFMLKTYIQHDLKCLKQFFLFSFFTVPGCNPWLWWACLHYLMNVKLRFHRCWSYQDTLPYQTRFWSHKKRSHFIHYQECQFVP